MRPVRRASVREAKIAAQPVVGQVAGRKAHWNRGTGPFSLSLSPYSNLGLECALNRKFVFSRNYNVERIRILFFLLLPLSSRFEFRTSGYGCRVLNWMFVIRRNYNVERIRACICALKFIP